MAHKDAGNYRGKHGADKRLNRDIAQAIEKRLVKGEITCAEASSIADELKVTMGEVGVAIDLLELRITKCQIGLFGYGDKKTMIEPAGTVSAELENAIRGALVDGRLPCVASWKIAQQVNVPKMHVAAACEALNIRIKPCQLGAF